MNDDWKKKPHSSSGGGYRPLHDMESEKPVKREETTRERAERQRRERRAELASTESDEERWARNRERVLTECGELGKRDTSHINFFLKVKKTEIPKFDLDEVLAPPPPELGAIKPTNIDPASMLADDIEVLANKVVEDKFKLDIQLFAKKKTEQPRGMDGRYITTGEPKPSLSRPSLRAETRRQIEATAEKDAFGNFIDENDNVVSDWHYGHKTGVENRRILKAADEMGMTQEQLNDFMNSRPDYYQIEDAKKNLSHADEKPDNGDLRNIKRHMRQFLKGENK